MSWVNTYKPNLTLCTQEYKAYNGQLKSEREKIKKSAKLVRKDYTNN